MSFATITLTYDGQIALITFNRPEKRNAISFELIDDLMRALDEVEHSEARVLILSGAGKAFCAGLDLEGLQGLVGKTHADNV